MGVGRVLGVDLVMYRKGFKIAFILGMNFIFVDFIDVLTPVGWVVGVVLSVASHSGLTLVLSFSPLFHCIA